MLLIVRVKSTPIIMISALVSINEGVAILLRECSTTFPVYKYVCVARLIYAVEE